MSSRGGLHNYVTGSIKAADNNCDEFTGAGDGSLSSERPHPQFDLKYVEALNEEKSSLDQVKFPNAVRLVSHEINRVTLGGDQLIDLYTDRPTQVAVKVRVPVVEYPQFNFIGKILGPKGNSLRRLQEETGCHITVCGRGSMRDKTKEEECRKAGGKYTHLNEDLHVFVACSGHPIEVYRQISVALQALRQHLVPDYSDEISKSQVQELAMIRGHVTPMRAWGMEAAPRPVLCSPLAPSDGVPRPVFGMRGVSMPGPRGPRQRMPAPRLGRGEEIVGSAAPVLGGLVEGFAPGGGIGPGMTPSGVKNPAMGSVIPPTAGGGLHPRAKRPRPTSSSAQPTGSAVSGSIYSNDYEYDEADVEGYSGNSSSSQYKDRSGASAQLNQSSSLTGFHSNATAASTFSQYSNSSGYGSAADMEGVAMTTEMLSGATSYKHTNLPTSSWETGGKMSGGYGKRMQSVQGDQSSIGQMSGPYPGSMVPRSMVPGSKVPRAMAPGSLVPRSMVPRSMVPRSFPSAPQEFMPQQQGYEQQMMYGQQQQQYAYY